MKTQINVKTSHKKFINFIAATLLMDNDICDKLHMKLAPCTNQKFYNAYVKAHFKKFNEIFEPDKIHGQW